MKRVHSLSRPATALLGLAFVALVLLLDLGAAGAPDLFRAPPPFALGSGQAPGGAHCTGN